MADWFEPGYKAGGPIRSCVNFVQQMKDRYAIYIITTDRDLDATAPYDNVEINKWTSYGEGVEILYCSPGMLTWKQILKQVKQVAPAFIYLNSMFSKYFTIYPLLMVKRELVNTKIILSPRGMLKSSALQFKQTKKKIYLFLFRLLGLHKIITFHATDVTEQADIKKIFGKKAEPVLASNFPGVVKEYPGSIPKNEKELSVIFIGRIHPIKNLDYLLNCVSAITGSVLLTVVGNEENKEYAQQCREMVQSFPPAVKVQFTGEIPNNEMSAVIAKHHIFALPTRGENFGHAIFEALAAGKPVLISDQTPWKNLAAVKAGWDIPLQQNNRFRETLQQAVDFNQQQYNEWSKGAWEYISKMIQQSELKKAYNKLFS